MLQMITVFGELCTRKGAWAGRVHGLGSMMFGLRHKSF